MTTEAEPAHYSYGPSSAHRWLICTDSPNAEAPYPNETSDPADEGTAAHWLLEQCLAQNVSVAEWKEMTGFDRVQAGVVTGCVKDWPVNGDMAEAVQTAIDAVRKISDKKGAKLFLEERVKLGPQYDLKATVGGTADIIIYLPRSKTLYVYDYKHGKGHVVEVDKSAVPGVDFNTQGGLYTLGVLSEVKRLLGEGKEVKKIVMGIIQPRAYHKKGPVRTKTIDTFDLMALEGAIIDAVNGEPKRVAGEEQCLFCRAKPDCQEYQTWRSDEVAGNFEAEAPAVAEGQAPANVPQPPTGIEEALKVPVKGLSLAQLGAVRGSLGQLKKWIAQVEDEIKVRLENDLPVPGARLAQGNGKRYYGGDDDDLSEAVSKSAKVLCVDAADLYEPARLKSPAALEKHVGKTVFKNLPLAKHVVHVAGGPIVVDEDSDRPEYVDPDTAGFTAEVENINDDPLL